jgi:hypothetical protein
MMLMGIKIPLQDGLDKREVLLAILLFSLCMWALVWEFTRLYSNISKIYCV